MADPNEPGLGALRYRAGTHSSFKARMLAALEQKPALATLTTRRDDDPSIALVDSWAAVLDVLAFYQERIANEGYVRTAIERRSVLELARALGYELNPGVAASAYLAFAVSELDGSPPTITVPAGTRVQSVPTETELPQTFETQSPLDARAEWNALRPYIAPMVPTFGALALHVRGTTHRIAKGDLLLVIGDEGTADPASREYDLRRVKEVVVVPPSIGSSDPNGGYTSLVLDRFLGTFLPSEGSGPIGGGPSDPFDPFDPFDPSDPFGDSGPLDLPGPILVPAPYLRTNARVYVFRQTASLFGHNAPDWRSMSNRIQNEYDDADRNPDQWPRFNLAYALDPAPTSTIHLDAIYARVTAGAWIVLVTGELSELYRVVSRTEDARADFTLAAKTSRLTLDRPVPLVELDGELGPPTHSLRNTLVFADPEVLELAPPPSSPAIGGRTVILDRVVGDLAVGQPIVVTGVDASTGESAAELSFVSSVTVTGATTELLFEGSLSRAYAPETMTLHANVALATHGQATSEILGSGSASLAFQKFALKQAPLTHVSAANATGAASTLVVRVNGIAWTEVPSLYGWGPDDRVFATRIEDDGTAIVQFGDGVTGARVPSGVENVIASYRVGLGTAGLVDAGRISLLLTRPIGLDGATNRVASSGAADPETIDEAREHAPLTVLTLDRIVSLRDFEDFAGAFAGIAKAQASLVWNGQRRVVHLTVGGVGGAPVDPTSTLLANLRTAIDAARQTDQPVQIDSYRALAFRVEAKLTIDSRYLAADVLALARTALTGAFAFSKRAFAAPVSKSEVLAILQAVQGVVAIDLDALHLSGTTPSLEAVIRANRALFGAGGIEPAELLVLAPDVVLVEA
jgi:hypothetical protein